MISSLIKRTFFFLAVLFNTFGYAQEISKDSVFLSLDDVWSKAEVFSKELKVQHLKTEIGKENILDAKNKRLPSLNFDASYGKLSNIPVFVNGINNSATFIPIEDHSVYDASVSAYFNIYAGGASKTAIKTAEASKEFLEHIEEETSDQLHLEVIQYYVSLQRSYQYENLVKQNIKQNAERVRLIEQLFKNGVVLKSDFLRAKLQLAKLQTQLVTIKNDLVIVTQALNILVGNEDDTLLIPSDTIQTKDIAIDKNYETFVSEMLSESPLEKMAEKQIELSELKTVALKADKLPKIGFFGSYTYSYPQIKLYPYEQAPYLLGVAGIKLSYDISALYYDKHKEKAAEIAVEQQKLAKENVDDNLRKQVKTAYSRFKEDVIKIEVAEENIQSAQENYRIVKQTYFNQLSLLTDLIDADTQQLEAHFELINNQIAAKVHYYQLLKISGKL